MLHRVAGMAFNFSAVQLDCFAGPSSETPSQDSHRSPLRSRRNSLAAPMASTAKHKVLRWNDKGRIPTRMRPLSFPAS